MVAEAKAKRHATRRVLRARARMALARRDRLEDAMTLDEPLAAETCRV